MTQDNIKNLQIQDPTVNSLGAEGHAPSFKKISTAVCRVMALSKYLIILYSYVYCGVWYYGFISEFQDAVGYEWATKAIIPHRG